ncbi:MAG TPA: hypothetical protein VGF10_01415 [Gaiella sp.]|jgi:hypothetical protein
MTISVVLRLADAALDAGRLAGEAELVATGERVTVRDADELLAFVRRETPSPRREESADHVGDER